MVIYDQTTIQLITHDEFWPFIAIVIMVEIERDQWAHYDTQHIQRHQINI